MRLVSMLPSATEIVYALGLGDDLVGVTFECDEPPQARTDKTVVVGGKDTSGMTPGEIDAYVRSQLATTGDLYTLHANALARLAPDLILTQDLCRVCALPSGDVTAALDYLGCEADVLSLDPYTLEQVLQTFVAVGGRARVPERADALVAGLRARLDRTASAVAGRPKPRVAVVEWVDPPFTAGHWIPDLVRAAGGEPVAHSAGAPSVQTSWEAIAAAAPEVVLVAPCGYHLPGAVTQAEQVARSLAGAMGAAAMAPASGPADRSTQRSSASGPTEVSIWAIDADGIVVRPGPRLVDGVEAIAALLHPGAVPAAPPGRIQRVMTGAESPNRSSGVTRGPAQSLS